MSSAAHGPVLKYPIVTNTFYDTVASTAKRGFRLAFFLVTRVAVRALTVSRYLG